MWGDKSNYTMLRLYVYKFKYQSKLKAFQNQFIIKVEVIKFSNKSAQNNLTAVTILITNIPKSLTDSVTWFYYALKFTPIIFHS